MRLNYKDNYRDFDEFLQSVKPAPVKPDSLAWLTEPVKPAPVKPAPVMPQGAGVGLFDAIIAENQKRAARP